jgi:hypothetical protein
LPATNHGEKTAMINKILTIIDHLDALENIEAGNGNQIAQKAVEPIFADLVFVHLYYMEMLEKTLELLNLPANDEMEKAFLTQDAKNYLRERRRQLAPLKAVLKDQPNGHKQPTVESDIVRFAGMAAQYICLPIGLAQPGKTGISFYLNALTGEHVVRDTASPYPGRRPNTINSIYYIESAIRVTEEAWSNVCLAYAKIMSIKNTE